MSSTHTLVVAERDADANVASFQYNFGSSHHILASNVGTTELKRSSFAWKESPTKSLREFPWRNLCFFLKTQDVAKQIGA